MPNRSNAPSHAALILTLAMLFVGGCAAAKPGDPAVEAADQSWLKQPNLFDRFDTSARAFHPLNAYLLALAVRAPHEDPVRAHWPLHPLRGIAKPLLIAGRVFQGLGGAALGSGTSTGLSGAFCT